MTHALEVATLFACEGHDELFCVVDSGANVVVLLWKDVMAGEQTTCVLVRDTKRVTMKIDIGQRSCEFLVSLESFESI